MTLPALAISDDIEARLGRTITGSESDRVAALIDDASASVRSYMRQEITQATSTQRLRVRKGIVRLPQRPVTAVASVADINANPILFVWEGFDTVRFFPNLDSFEFVPWLNGISAVDVTYTHGYPADETPGDIVAVVCSVTMRALGRDPVDAGLTSESIQGYSYSVGSVGAAGPLGLLQSEKDILDGYLRAGGSVRTGV